MKIKNLFLVLSLIFYVWIQTSCKHDTIALDSMRKICYKSEIAPLLNSKCGTCHGAKSGGGEDVNVSSYSGVMQMVTKGNPSSSKLYQVITTNMPPSKETPLSQDQRTLVYAWILQGADTLGCQ